MLKVNQLSGFGGRRSQKGDFEVDLIDFHTSTVNTVHTFTNLSIGAPKAGPQDNRLVLLHVTAYEIGSPPTFDSVEYNGANITSNVIATDTGGTFIFPFTFVSRTSLFKNPDNSSSSTANVTVTISSSASLKMSVCVVRNISSYSETTAAANAIFGDPATYVSTTTTIPNGEIGICLGYGIATDLNWSGDSVENETIANASHCGSLALITGDGTSKTANVLMVGSGNELSLTTTSFSID